MKKTVYKNPAQIETLIFFGLGFLFLILFIVIPVLVHGFSKDIFWSKDSIASFAFPVAMFVLVYWFFLTKWEKIVVEDIFLRIRYSRFFLPCYTKLTTTEIKEVVFVYNGHTDGKRKFSKDIIKDLKNKVGEKIDNLLFQQGFCETASYSNGNTGLNVGLAKFFLKIDNKQIPIKFFSKKVTQEILTLLPKDLKKTWRFGRIEYSDASDLLWSLPE